MAQYEGDFELRVDKESLSDAEQKKFEVFMKEWRNIHPMGYYDWIEEFDGVEYQSISWGTNNYDNIHDLHAFLIKAAKAFPGLVAKGSGNSADMMTGTWNTKYSFILQDGNLEWNEDEHEHG